MSEEFVPREESQPEAKIPDQKYFKIAEASHLLGVKPHVLRYWETEFPQIRPCKSKSGQRLYRRRDFEALQHIQKLLYQERCTIAGARQALRLIYENDAPVIEENREDLVEADMNLTQEEQVVAAPVAASNHNRHSESHDVLEIVEEKMAYTQMHECLEKAHFQLQGMLMALES